MWEQRPKAERSPGGRGAEACKLEKKKLKNPFLSSWFLVEMSCKWGGSPGKLAWQESSTCFISLSCPLVLVSRVLRIPVGLIPASTFPIPVLQTFLPGCVASDCCFGQSANYTAWQPGWWQSLHPYFFFKKAPPMASSGIINYFLQLKFLVKLSGQRKKKPLIPTVSLIFNHCSKLPSLTSLLNKTWKTNENYFYLADKLKDAT